LFVDCVDLIQQSNAENRNFVVVYLHIIYLQIVHVFREPIPSCFDFFELGGDRIEPRIGFRDLHRGQRDQVGHLTLGTHQGELVLHGQRMGHFGFSVQFFLRFFSPRPGRSRLTTWTGAGTMGYPKGIPPSPPQGGGGGEQSSCQPRVGTVYACTVHLSRSFNGVFQQFRCQMVDFRFDFFDVLGGQVRVVVDRRNGVFVGVNVKSDPDPADFDDAVRLGHRVFSADLPDLGDVHVGVGDLVRNLHAQSIRVKPRIVKGFFDYFLDVRIRV